ncbi:M16 family metallopeptidase [Hallella absiana]|uniref:M16 family metallopeptidase n=1 Tax=Hallella absiana TaxID=2925336 RepID=UPI0021C6D7F8|nr:M16 family metallopeptidase [Hallella absiana]
MTRYHNMTKGWLCVLLAVLGWTVVYAQGAWDVQTLRLHNGFTVWLNIDHSQPKVYGAVVVKAGAKDCPNTGIAHYFEHLMFKGTDKIGTVDYEKEKPWLDSISHQYDLLAATSDPSRRLAIQKHINALSVRAADYAIPNEFQNLITRFGGTGLNAYTSFDETVFYNTFSPPYLSQWCELYAERFLSPVFRLFQGELETVYEEKNMYSDNMLVQAAEAAQRYALAGTPYAYPIIGATDSLKNPRLSEMMRFYHRYYVAGNMGLILCGDLRADSIMPLLERTFGRLPMGQAPQTPKAVLRDFRGSKPLKLKLPIPVVKAEGYAFLAPQEGSRDEAPFQVMMTMLSNPSHTGLLDSLDNAGKVMAVMAGSYYFKDFGAFGFGFVPNLPFGSKKKASRRCWQAIGRLRTGQFDDAQLHAVKRSLIRQKLLSLETVSGRSSAMINAFSHGLSWHTVLAQAARIDSVTHDDVVRVARTYFNDDSLVVKKTFGHYPKERVAQPGYQPVRARHAGEQSEYAKQLEAQPVDSVAPKLVDFKRDVAERSLCPLVRLYGVKNPDNEIFSLQLCYRRGSATDHRIEILGDYLNRVGTTSKSRQQMGRELQQLGATLDVSADAGNVKVTLMGFDSQFVPALRLLRSFLDSAATDNAKLRVCCKELRLNRRSFLKENANIADAIYQKVALGDSSPYLSRLTVKEARRLKASGLVNLFREVQRSQLDIIYTGTLPVDSVAHLAATALPLDKVCRPWRPVLHPLQSVDVPTVYVYDNSRARQTIVGSYQQVGALPSDSLRAPFHLWGTYFGGGMSSVLFQDIREFRSYAYYAYGRWLQPDLLVHPQSPCAYVTRLGCQSDKTMAALGVLDSVLRKMPVREENVRTARQGLVNAVNNGYPAFRSLGSYVATCRLKGYTLDPDSVTLRLLPKLGIGDVIRFYQNHVQNTPACYIIVGDKRKLDMKQLKRYGRVVLLRKRDISR